MEQHHSIPLAIGWVESKDNKIWLEKTPHKMTHMILDIPYRFIRNYRKKLNWVVLLTEQILEAERKMQLKYFDNVTELPKDLFKLHYENITQQAWEETKELITFTEWRQAIITSINKMIDIREEMVYNINNILWESDYLDLSPQERQAYMKTFTKNDI